MHIPDDVNATRLLRIRRAVEHMVELNNHGVLLLGEGSLELARAALCQAINRIQHVLDAQAQHVDDLETIDPLGERSCGAAGVCFVTPLEPVVIPPSSSTEDNVSSSERYHATSPQTPTTITITSSSFATTSFINPNNNQRDDHRFSDASVQIELNAAPPYMTVRKDEAPPQLPFSPQEQEPQSTFLLSHSFLRPILFSSEDFVQAKNPPITQLSVSLFFNLAVINHKLALLAPSPIDMWPLLEEAIYSYRLAYIIQMEEKVEVSRLHTLGIVNNLGLLYHHAEMYVASKDCFQTLSEMIIKDQVQAHLSIQGRGLPAALESLYARYTEIFLDNIFEVFATHANAPAA